MPVKNHNELTPLQQKFVDFYLQTGNGTQSVILAGYKVAQPDKMSNLLLKKSCVINYIEKKKKTIENRIKSSEEHRIATTMDIKAFWSSVMMDDKQEMKDRLKAAELMAKTYGLFVNRVQVSGSVNHMAKLDYAKMSDDELRCIIDGYNQPAICYDGIIQERSEESINEEEFT